MSDTRFVVLGAGPAGSATATFLARAGRDVTLIDADAAPRVAVGESLLPQAGEILTELGVDMSGFLVKRGAVFTLGEASTRFDFGNALRGDWPHAWQCPRAELDRRLRAVATASGARLHVARVRGVTLPGVVHTDHGDVTADVVIDAAGRGQLLARQLGLGTTYPDLRNAARTAWFRGVRWQPEDQPGDIVISAFPGGWFWMIPFADGQASVGLVGPKDVVRGDDAVERAIEACAAAARRLDGAERLESWRGASDFTVSSTRLYGPGWALVGDAATFLDPVFSSGLTFALHGARWLAEALLHDDLEGYEAKVREAIGAFLPAIRAFYDGTFHAAAFSGAGATPGTVRGAVVSLLAGDVFDPAFTTARRISQRFPDLARLAHR